jgi:hypothetical protein
MNRSVVLVCASVLGITACGGPSVTTAVSSTPTTTPTPTTSNVAIPIAGTRDAGMRVDLAMKDLKELLYSSTVIDESNSQPITADFVNWRVDHVRAVAHTGAATIFAKHQELSADEKFDIAVDQAGLTSAVTRDPAAWVHEVCAGIAPNSNLLPVEELQSEIGGDDGRMKIAVMGIPIICPEQQRTLQDLQNGNLPIYAGTREIGSGPDQIKPGTYRTTGSVDDCYWERTGPDGKIIDNNFATHAQQITVTIRATDGSFTSERCGKWVKAG